MLRGPRRSRSFFKKLVVNGVNNSKAAIQNDCLMRLYDADAELKAISNELDSFDGKKDPIRCNLLVNQLRTAQDKVISLLFQFMDDCNCERASRDYRMKFPDEILLSEGSESLNGQIWFGAECLSAGSNILNHTKESTMLRPMAKTLTQHLDSLRNDLRDLVIDGCGVSRINQSLLRKMINFDRIFASFEYEYVRTMLPIRTVAEIEKLQEVAVLFSETLIDCVKRGLIKQDDIDEFQPIVMIAIPRLAIVRGLLYKNENPIYTKHKSHMCSLFQPFHGPLHSIRRLLRGLSQKELFTLERMLANDQSNNDANQTTPTTVDESRNSGCNGSMQCKIDDQANRSCESEFASQASTSNNYANVLMDGLQYPVGHKRSGVGLEGNDCYGNTEPSEDDKGQLESYNCYLEVQPSSSKESDRHDDKHELNHRSPTTSTPSSISSTGAVHCRKCDDANDVDIHDGDLRKNDCDNGNCCLSSPESESQLEKMMANFSPSMKDDSNDQSETFNQNVASDVTNLINQDNIACSTIINNQNQLAVARENTHNATAEQRLKRVKSKRQTASKSDRARDEAALERLFQKQAEQLLHRLFVAISGVADQLQSNFASDLRFILRHIFSSQIANDEDEDGIPNEVNEDDEVEEEEEDGDYSNNEHSDSSLPIEQGVEAQEVANLIDLESGYSPNEPSFTHTAAQDESLHIINQMSPTTNAPPTSEFTPTNHAPENAPVVIDLSSYNSTDVSTIYVPCAWNHYYTDEDHQQNYNNGQQPINIGISGHSNYTTDHQQSSLEDHTINEIIVRDQTNVPDQDRDLIYETRNSPNDPSIMDNDQHRQQLLQRHLQSATRLVNRVNQRTMMSGQQQQAIGNNRQQTQGVVERRSRHHHGSRSRRSRGPPVWVPDQLVVQCNSCQAPFTLFRRRHHCRACGQIFCAECSRYTKNLNCWGYNGPVRVCEACFNQPDGMA